MEAGMADRKLIETAEPVAGEPLVAAGVFKLHEDLGAIFAGGVVGTALPSFGHAAAAGAETDLGADAARAMVAHKKGLTPDMVVAVSERYVHILSIPSTTANPENPLAMVGLVEPGPELMRFDRESAEIRSKVHLRRVYLKLSDDQNTLGLVSAQTESIGGGKQVAAALAA
jgi:hypothetical protein